MRTSVSHPRRPRGLASTWARDCWKYRSASARGGTRERSVRAPDWLSGSGDSQLTLRGAQHSADWGKRSRFLAKGKRLFPRSLCNADHTNFCQIAAKRKKSQKNCTAGSPDGERKSQGASCRRCRRLAEFFLRFPTAFPRQTTASPTEDRLLAKRRWLSGVSRLSPASGRPSSPHPTRRSACTSPR